MIPLVLITGFLGSGKTTLLQRIAASPQGKDAVFLVNEFADLNIDATRVQTQGTEVFEVSGGSLFCQCKVSDFLSNLKKIHQFFEEQDRRLNGVIIETSGIANPEVMSKLLLDTGLNEMYYISQIISLVSPYRFERYLSAYPNLIAQIKTSDSVIINKIDLFSKGEISLTRNLICEVREDVSIVEAQFAEVDIDLWKNAKKYESKGAISTPENPYSSVSIIPSKNVDIRQIQELCESNSDIVLRAKGEIISFDNHVRFDFSNGVFTLDKWERNGDTSRLVLIVGKENKNWALECREKLE